MNSSQLLTSKARIGATLNLLGAVAGLLFWWAATLVVVELFIAETVSLGPWFDTMAGKAAPVIALSIVISLKRIGPRVGNWLIELHKRNHRSSILVATAIFLSIVIVSVTPVVAERMSRTEDAERALQSFIPVYNSRLEPEKVLRTLAEFERARRYLAKQWVAPDWSPRIPLHLFPDITYYQDYMATRNLGWAGGHVSCDKNGVTINVPLEHASNVLEEMPASRTPVHEMVHAIWCQSLGHNHFWSIPLWFHEGMAQRYANELREQFTERNLNRWIVWLSRDELMSAGEFCDFSIHANRAPVQLFYRTSWEFIRSLESNHGIESLNEVVWDVGAGISFNDSLRGRFGATCHKLYSDWTQGV